MLRRGTDHGLHQRGVGGQARQHLTGLGGLEKLGALLHHMGVHGIAQVGGDALPEPGHHVEACCREQPQGRTDTEQGHEVLAHGHHPCAGVVRHEALVDQRFQRDRKHQGADRRHHQEEHAQRDAAAVRPQERQQPAQRACALGRGPHGLRVGTCRSRHRGRDVARGCAGIAHAQVIRIGPARRRCWRWRRSWRTWPAPPGCNGVPGPSTGHGGAPVRHRPHAVAGSACGRRW